MHGNLGICAVSACGTSRARRSDIAQDRQRVVDCVRAVVPERAGDRVDGAGGAVAAAVAGDRLGHTQGAVIGLGAGVGEGGVGRAVSPPRADGSVGRSGGAVVVGWARDVNFAGGGTIFALGACETVVQTEVGVGEEGRGGERVRGDGLRGCFKGVINMKLVKGDHLVPLVDGR